MQQVSHRLLRSVDAGPAFEADDPFWFCGNAGLVGRRLVRFPYGPIYAGKDDDPGSSRSTDNMQDPSSGLSSPHNVTLAP